MGGRRVHRQDVSLAAIGSCWQPPVAHEELLPEQLHPAAAEELEFDVELVGLVELELEVALATG